jgi:hypothetical protein
MKIVFLFVFAGTLYGQNAALRYWSAIAQMRDSSATPDQAKELNAILEGAAPYEDAKQRDLVERNRAAVETMQRGAELADCDWGLEYQLGPNAPIEYVRKALALGRLNVLYAFHQAQTGDRDGAARSLARGLRFAQHVSSGGPLFAAVVSKSLLVSHLKALDSVVKSFPVSQKQTLLANLGGVDWPAAITRDLQAAGAPTALQELYRKALAGGSLEALQKGLETSPLRNRIPKPERILAEKRELDERIASARSMLSAK